MHCHFLIFFTQVLKTLTSRIHSGFTSHLHYKTICLHRMCAKAWLDWRGLFSVSSSECGNLCFFKKMCVFSPHAFLCTMRMPGVYSAEQGVWYSETAVPDSWAAVWILGVEPRSTKTIQCSSPLAVQPWARNFHT